MEGLGGFLPEDPAPAPLPQRLESAGVPPAVLGPVPPPSAPSYVDELAEADASAVTEGCSCCSSLSFSQEWLAAFGVALCTECRRSEKLISKTTAKQRYAVTDGDLKKLGSLRRANVQNKSWQPMHLYLESQVRQLSDARHGSIAGVEAYQRQLLDARLEKRMKRREEERQREERDEERLRRIKSKLMEDDEAKAGQSTSVIDAAGVEDI